MQQLGEPVLVEAFAAQAAVERFDLSVLVRLTGRDQPKLHTAVVGPRHHRLAAELLAVVGADDLWQAARERQTVEHCFDRPDIACAASQADASRRACATCAGVMAATICLRRSDAKG